MQKEKFVDEFEVFNSYEVTYVFEFCCISVTVMARDTDTMSGVEDHAILLVGHQLNISEDVLLTAHDIVVELRERDVYNAGRNV